MIGLAESIEGLALALEAAAKKKRRGLLLVASYSGFDAKGKPIGPKAIESGDTLYLQRPSEPGAGLLRAPGANDYETPTTDGHLVGKANPGRPYATALESLIAGKISEIATKLLEKRWVVDGNPCEICIANEAAGWIPADEDFPSGDEEPTAHPNCFIGGTVVSAGRVRATMTRWYSGEVVVLRGPGIDDTTVTPNHPILTSAGWIAAGELKRGDHIVQCSDPPLAAALIDPDDHHVETRIEQITSALFMAGSVARRSVPVSSVDFHGDVHSDGQVDIVRATRLLTSDGHAEALKFAKHFEFALSRRQLAVLIPGGARTEIGHRSLRSAHGVVGGSGHTGPLFGAHPRVSDALCLTLASLDQPGNVPSVGDRLTGDPCPFSDRLDRLSGLMRLVQLSEVERRHFDGHVYNLETLTGMYFANSIVSHNCECDLEVRRADEGD